eukprot:TRINITY_DN59192_c0_g1_i7.p1 TRINITY_DN59192_c0_g1~~TRINITY_DN59192_c0_g1_i7.p1  ORF type:complete len:204 (-),score=33.35 TRINITY_DN59192_c0_g1_i7:675-1286(-)
MRRDSSHGEEALQAGRLLRAAETFTWGVHRCTQSSTMFHNLAVALATLASEEVPSEVTSSRRTALVCEARAAADVAAALGHKDSLQLLAGIDEVYKATRSCEYRFGPQALRPGPKHADADSHLERVNDLCSNTSAATVSATSSERERSQWSADQFRTVLVLFRVCGAVAIEGLLLTSLLDTVNAAQGSHRRSLAAASNAARSC